MARCTSATFENNLRKFDLLVGKIKLCSVTKHWKSDCVLVRGKTWMPRDDLPDEGFLQLHTPFHPPLRLNMGATADPAKSA